MPVRIVGSASFAGRVLTELRRICPCRSVAVLADQTVTLGPADACICSHGAGCGLVSRLVEGPILLRIAGPCCTSTYSAKDRKIYLCPDQRLPSCFGRPPGPPAVTLAHELIHALLDLYETSVPNTELVTARAENQIRRELGVAPRCCYESDEVPITGGFLDGAWAPDNPHCLPGSIDVEGDVRKALWDVRWTLTRVLADLLGVKECPGTSRRPARRAGTNRLDRLIERGQRYRDRQAVAPKVDRAVRSLEDEPGVLIHLEQAVVDAGLRTLVLHLGPEWTTAVTNVGVDPDGHRLVPLGGLYRYRFPATGDPVVRPIPSFPEGPGGDPLVFDGATTWLTVRNGAVASTAYYGLHQPVDPCKSDPPADPGDRKRWEAVNTVYDTWIDLSAKTPTTVMPV